jgi:spore coat protein CotF
MGNWDNGQFSTLNKGDTRTCNTLAEGQLYGVFLYNTQSNDQEATVMVNWSNTSAPVQVTVPGTLNNAGLATIVLVWGGDTSTVAVSITETSANPQVSCWLGSVSMPFNTTDMINQPLPNNGASLPFGTCSRYYAAPPSAWQELTISSPNLTQFISAQFQDQFATIYIVNPAENAAPAVVGVGSVSKSPPTYYTTVSGNQNIQQSIMGNGLQWVWMNADSGQDSTAAKISLQALS